jgi:hypothetical protein
MKNRFDVGARVQLTGQFLRNTGQMLGGEGLSVWTVVACSCSLCATGRFVATNEPSYDEPERPRHFAAGNLKRLGELTSRDTP